MTPTSATDGKPRPALADAPWLRSPALARIFSAFKIAGQDIRVVGGAPRNALLGLPIADIDLATPATPEIVTEIAEAAGLAVHPTGIAHGTVTVVADGAPFEITTLRRDVETDGRRAVVAYTRDWHEDAVRRDFTINAIYVDAAGTIFDPTGGLADVAAARVRFIGDPSERIREDYLRILRFFRFTSAFGTGAPDAAGLAACQSLKSGLAQLSSERVGAEVLKLLDTPRAAGIADVMAASGILETVLGHRGFPERLLRLAAIEKAHAFAPDPLTRLCALAAASPESVAGLAHRFRLSNGDAEALARAAEPHPAYDPSVPEKIARAWLYRCGQANFRRGSLVAWAASDAAPDDASRKARTTLPDRWWIPAHPFRGADIIGLGVPPGPRVGAILADFEAWWIREDFPADPALHKAALQTLINRS